MKTGVRWRALWLMALVTSAFFVGCARGPSKSVEDPLLLGEENEMAGLEWNDAEEGGGVSEEALNLEAEKGTETVLSDPDDDTVKAEAEDLPASAQTEDLTADETMKSVPYFEEEEISPADEEVVSLPATDALYEEATSLLSRGEAGTPASIGLPELGSKMPYVIQSGDTLSMVAKKVFGDSGKWKDIAELSGIKNANLVYPGEVVYYQLNEESLVYAEAELKKEEVVQFSMVVKSGDTLSKIAQEYYGSSQGWTGIWQNNSHVKSPDSLEVGTLIYLQKDLVSKSSLLGSKGRNIAKTLG